MENKTVTLKGKLCGPTFSPIQNDTDSKASSIYTPNSNTLGVFLFLKFAIEKRPFLLSILPLVAQCPAALMENRFCHIQCNMAFIF